MSATTQGGGGRLRVAVAATGAANIASVLAGLGRTGAEPFTTGDPDEIRAAEFAILPGVGAFGPVRGRIAEAGLDAAFVDRFRAGKPILGICLGMQLCFEGSEEAPGVAGLGLAPGILRRFDGGLPLPQLGWNRIGPGRGTVPGPGREAEAAPRRGEGAPTLLSPGWVYFANSYRLSEAPAGWTSWWASYGEPFIAAVERPAPGAAPGSAGGTLLCQFHPELSGTFGLGLLRRWLGLGQPDSPPGGTVHGGAASEDGAYDGDAVRVVPCLDLRNGRVVKGTRFKDLVDSGDPAELAARYEAEGADEIALLDIDATVEGRNASLEALRRVRARVGIPLVFGGGIRTEEDARVVLDAGADRVSANSAAVADPSLLSRLATRFGKQCVVLAIDARTRPDGRRAVVVEAGRRETGLEAAAWAVEGARLGAGEILLTSIDRDGTGEGFDLGLIEEVAAACGVPVIASGGAANTAHFSEAAKAGARALLAAGVFHRGELGVAEVKRHLETENIGVRP